MPSAAMSTWRICPKDESESSVIALNSRTTGPPCSVPAVGCGDGAGGVLGSSAPTPLISVSSTLSLSTGPLVGSSGAGSGSGSGSRAGSGSGAGAGAGSAAGSACSGSGAAGAASGSGSGS